ncbi:mycothiol synthase [Microbacterium sp. STN6]|uniref:mycothiol synthase n=1 Tax=Microbacterium sp. STN6 TaxID=2995588 RepID=UPI002260D6A0|nr:mycothiol synthase [Microbacterium sp. STN6]MCX7523377.1 mycothiol synthase [Microbacterium sp. STN6]
MSASLRLSVADLGQPAAASAFHSVADAAQLADGADPFNEQARLDVAAGRRAPVLLRVAGGDGATAGGDGATAGGATVGGETVGAAIAGDGALDLVVDPRFRGHGYATAALEQLLPDHPGDLVAWSHGDHPAARALAPRFGFALVRTLLQLRLARLPAASTAARSKTTEILPGTGAEGGTDAASASLSPSFSIGAFRPGADEGEWVRLNARVFHAHPEQGRVSEADLADREAEPWFDAGDFLVARDAAGRMVGYNWLKIEPGSDEGEIYVIGVDSAAAGKGLGRRLLEAGLARLSARGCRSATLYVEGDNEPALRLYRSSGFIDHMIDVQYRRAVSAHDAMML